MPPASNMSQNSRCLCVESSHAPVLEMASAELEQMKKDKPFPSFPPACLAMLKSIQGNHRCIDCGEQDPQWATVSYGALICLECSGKHRSLGVQTSCVRSIGMDDWSQAEVVSMLEGGNAQLQDFYQRHNLCQESDFNNATLTKKNVTTMRYKTKASLFYRQQLGKHVAQVLQKGAYQGREASRRQRRPLDHRNSSVL